jgi:nucleotide-binding universal stress UspA family protein
MLKHIVVGLDGSPLAETILPTVVSLAAAFKARVSLLHIVDVPAILDEEGRGNVEQIVANAEATAGRYLHDLARRYETTSITVQGTAEVGSAPHDIVSFAQEQHADLIALATHGRSGWGRWLNGSVADEVSRTSPVPVLLLRPGDEIRDRAFTITQIIVPLDGSPGAEAALPWAEALSRQLGAPLILLRAVEPHLGVPAIPGDIVTGEPDTLTRLRLSGEQYLEGTAAPLRARGVETRTEASFGYPETLVFRCGEEHPGSLVVMTTHGRSGVWLGLLGSVARRVVQEANTPVLLVRPTGKAARTAGDE